MEDFEGTGKSRWHLPDEIGAEELSEILLNTQEQCQMVDNLIRNQIQVKDALIDKLHEELEYYKKDSADRFIDQVMKAVIKVRKDMMRQMHAEGWTSKTADELRKEYGYIFEDLTDLLEQQNIDAYETDAGKPFDASRHQAKLEQTEDPGLDKMVKESVSEGYMKGQKVLIPERVIVYQYKQ